MHRWKWLPLVIAAGCAIPSRDNPTDPQNRLPFRAYVALESGERSDIGSHGATWTLDAREACPNGCALDFDTDGNPGNGYELSSNEPVLETTLVVSSDAFAAVQTISRKISIRRSDGARGDAIVVLTNAPPDASTKDRFLPSAIGPATFPPFGISQRVVLDACGEDDGVCASKDPDGDPVTFEWRIIDPDGTITLEPDPTDPTGARVSFVVPGGEERVYLFELEASDPWRSSRTISRVFVGPQVWLSYDSRLVRVATMPTKFSEPAVGGPCYSGSCETGALAFDVKYGGAWVAYTTTSAERVVAHYRDDPYFPDDPVWTLPSPLLSSAGPAAIAAEASRGLVILEDASLLVLEPFGSVTSPVTLPQGETARFVARAGDGTFWVVTQSVPGVFDPLDGSFVPVTTASLEDPVTAAPGPQQSLLIVDNAGGSLRLLHVHADGAVESCALPDVGAVAGVSEGPQDSTWLLARVFGQDDFRVALVDGACEVELVSDFTVPLPSVITSVPREGSAWVMRNGAAYHVRRGLNAIVVESVAHAADFATPASSGSGGRLTGMQVDPGSGNLLAAGWFSDPPAGIVIADVPLSDEGVREIQPEISFSRIAIEPAAASIWTADDEGVLLRVTPGGRVLATSEVSNVVSVAPVSDGGAWVAYVLDASTFGVVRIDAAGVALGSPIAVPVTPGLVPIELRLSAVHEATGIACAITRTFDVGGGVLGDGPAYRLDLLTGTATALSPVPSGAVDVGISFEDACWWVQTSPASAHRVGPNETVSRATALSSTPLGFAIGVSGDFHAYIRTSNGLSFVPFWDSIEIPLTNVPAGPGSAVGIGEGGCYGCNSRVWITAGATLYRGHAGAGDFVVETSLSIPEAGPKELHVLPGNSFLP